MIGLFPLLFVASATSLQTAARRAVNFTVRENVPAWTYVGNMASAALLLDSYTSAQVAALEYNVIRGNLGGDVFTVNRTNGDLRAGNVDRETLCPGRDVCLLALDVAVRPVPVTQFLVISVTVNVTDENDNRPTFPRDIETVNVAENVPIGSRFVLPVARDPDTLEFSVKSYRLSPTSEFGLTTEPELALILKRDLDREQRSEYTLTLWATDGGSPALTGTLQLRVQLVDANDNRPVFQRARYVASVAENAPPGTVVTRLTANDADSGDNGRVVYGWTPETETMYGDLFELNAEDGRVSIRKPLDHERQRNYVMTAVARDSGLGSISSRVLVSINVIDVNDHSPSINVNSLSADGRVELAENAATGTFVAYLLVRDEDAGDFGRVTCSLEGTADFELVNEYEHEFVVASSRPLDRELQARHDLIVRCADSGSPAKSTSALIAVHVVDVNDNTPAFEHDRYELELKENNNVNVQLARFHATDADFGVNAHVTYRISENVRKLVEIDSVSGVLRAKTVFDHESTSALEFRITASDSGKPPNRAEVAVQLRIIDTNDRAPSFSQAKYSFGIYENEPVDTLVGRVEAFDADSEPFNRFTFSLTGYDDEFSIDASSGEMATRRPLDRERRSLYEVTVTATNHGDATGEPTLSGTAVVSVYVGDRNDNSPVAQLPFNSTYRVALSHPAGLAFARVNASDLDVLENAVIRYDIVQDASGLFTIDSFSGELRLISSSDVPRRHMIVIRVSDTGEPPRSSESVLFVELDPTLQLSEEARLMLGSGNQQTVVAVVVLLAVVVILALLAVVIVLKYKQNRRKRSRTSGYHVDIKKSTELGKSESLYEARTNVSNSNASQAATFALHASAVPWPSSKPSAPQLQANRLLGFLTTDAPPPPAVDGDSTSESTSSAVSRDSNTDSGKGPSEDGENGLTAGAKSQSTSGTVVSTKPALRGGLPTCRMSCHDSIGIGRYSCSETRHPVAAVAAVAAAAAAAELHPTSSTSDPSYYGFYDRVGQPTTTSAPAGGQHVVSMTGRTPVSHAEVDSYRERDDYRFWARHVAPPDSEHDERDEHEPTPPRQPSHPAPLLPPRNANRRLIAPYPQRQFPSAPSPPYSVPPPSSAVAGSECNSNASYGAAYSSTSFPSSQRFATPLDFHVESDDSDSSASSGSFTVARRDSVGGMRRVTRAQTVV